mmetsp:Transcript_20684/g.62331  ORF Transcript_20684/g.62331 Transcript_20684/m.62331 type:complete len:230 (+) Transcript_20684:259-948(+)|eukprot:CAMPEP_0206137908 /NCGR_PEP_ID=MMETSP1473-20131121/2931_1 /ASSEMBLY_ACC=CAM_ASM_001109 /TAXON_ID=1461547 /ORGANISM="Stichococcus sp, Strain RCC1054" /LENGTH=229 /DNA_ID=CAMNT_0053531177 /DNA_START=187 /DNA_END=876 /DNA_ORIENTATION=+
MALPRALSGGPNGPPQKFGPIRSTLILAQLLTLIGFLIILGGLSKLQKTANALTLAAGNAAGDSEAAAITLVYTDVFQSAGQVPYPNNPKHQFAFQWFILFLELIIFVGIAVLATFPATILRLKHALASILTYAFVLLTLTGQSVLYFHRNAAAKSVYGETPINVTLAGILIVLVANGVTLITLGLIGTGSDFQATHPGHPGSQHDYDVRSKQVAQDDTPAYTEVPSKV